jgi:hypothetical protein
VAHERYVLEVTIGRTTREKLRHAQALLSHRLPGGDLAQVIDLALDALNERLERRKLGATQRPRRPRPGADPRYVPAHIRRLVWERDGGRCTFVSESGRRCDERSRLEFDHVEEIARGGRATVPGIRLRCRAHNQHTAECSFGAGLMARRREESRERAAAKQLSSARPAAAEVAGAEAPGTAIAGAPARAEACASTGAGGSTVVEEVFRPLRLLGFSREEARQAAALCEGMEDAPLEQRIKRALTWFQPRGTTRHRSVTPAAGGLVDRA